MTLRRILTIVIVLLVLVGLLFSASWYMSRRNAEKNGSTPLTFRQFLGIGTPAVPGNTTSGEFVSQFTTDTTTDKNSNGILDGEEDQNLNGTLDKDDLILTAEGQKTDVFNNSVKGSITVSALVFSRFADSNANRINDWNEDIDGNGVLDGIEDLDGNGTIDGYDGGLVISGGQNGAGGLITGGNPNGGGLPGDNGGFTSGPLMPIGSGLGTSGNPYGVPGTSSTSGSALGTTLSGSTPIKITDGDINPIDLPAGGTSTAKYCSDADTNIDFTQEEIARLNILQGRFYTIAQSLHNDADVQTEISNYDAFQVKAAQTMELYDYCQSKLPLITNPDLQKRVATPFWRDETKDSQSFLSTDGPTQGELAIDHSASSIPVLMRILQNVLRLNFW